MGWVWSSERKFAEKQLISFKDRDWKGDKRREGLNKLRFYKTPASASWRHDDDFELIPSLWLEVTLTQHLLINGWEESCLFDEQVVFTRTVFEQNILKQVFKQVKTYLGSNIWFETNYKIKLIKKCNDLWCYLRPTTGRCAGCNRCGRWRRGLRRRFCCLISLLNDLSRRSLRPRC